MAGLGPAIHVFIDTAPRYTAKRPGIHLRVLCVLRFHLLSYRQHSSLTP